MRGPPCVEYVMEMLKKKKGGGGGGGRVGRSSSRYGRRCALAQRTKGKREERSRTAGKSSSSMRPGVD